MRVNQNYLDKLYKKDSFKVRTESKKSIVSFFFDTEIFVRISTVLSR